MSDAFRQKQIREILDEDLRANREVLRREFRQAKVYDNDEFTEPTKLQEIVSWNIDKQISQLQESIQNVIDGAIDNANLGVANQDISKIATTYNLLVSYINNYAKAHTLSQRDKAVIDTKFNEIEPLLNQLKQILQHPDAYNVEVSAQNLQIIEHIDQQIRDSNYTGLNVINYRRIPVSKQPLRPAQYRGWNQRPPSENGDDNFGNFIPRGRNQADLSGSDLINFFSRRNGTQHEQDDTIYTPSSNSKEGSVVLVPTKSSSMSMTDRNLPDESITHVNTDSPFKKPTKNEKSPDNTPSRKLPDIPLPKVKFNGSPKNYATVDKKPIYDDDGSLIDEFTWYRLQPKIQEELIRRTLLQGKGKGGGKKGKKYFEPIEQPVLQYNPDKNNLWADYD